MSTTDTGIAFKKVSKYVKNSFDRGSESLKGLIKCIFRNATKLSFGDWHKYLNELSTTKKVDVNTIKNKLVNCGEPGFTGETV